jgi:hypothetical protein
MKSLALTLGAVLLFVAGNLPGFAQENGSATTAELNRADTTLRHHSLGHGADNPRLTMTPSPGLHLQYQGITGVPAGTHLY